MREPKWIHSKRKVTEPERLLGAYRARERAAGSSVVRTTSIYPCHRRSPDCALGAGHDPTRSRIDLLVAPPAPVRMTIHLQEVLELLRDVHRIYDTRRRAV